MVPLPGEHMVIKSEKKPRKLLRILKLVHSNNENSFSNQQVV